MLLGALTSSFVPAWSCQLALSSTSWNGTVYNVGPASTTNCFPTSYYYGRDDYYSASLCPLGYNTACSSTAAVSDSHDQIETIVTCCPAPLTCNTASDGVASTMGCYSVWDEPITISSLVSISGNIHKGTTSIVADSGTLNAYSVQIRFQATDVSSSPSAATPGLGASGTTPTATAAATTTTTTTINTPAATSTAASGRSKLGKAAVAGIAVGCAAGGVLVAGLVGLWCLRRKRNTPCPLERLASAEAGPGPGATAPPPGRCSAFTVGELRGSEAGVSELSYPSQQHASVQQGALVDETLFKYLPSDQIPVPKPRELPGHDHTPEMEAPTPVELPVSTPKQEYFMGRR